MRPLIKKSRTLYDSLSPFNLTGWISTRVATKQSTGLFLVRQSSPQARLTHAPFRISPLIPQSKRAVLCTTLFDWWAGVDSNHRRQCQQISLPLQLSLQVSLFVVWTFSLSLRDTRYKVSTLSYLLSSRLPSALPVKDSSN